MRAPNVAQIRLITLHKIKHRYTVLSDWILRFIQDKDNGVLYKFL